MRTKNTIPRIVQIFSGSFIFLFTTENTIVNITATITKKYAFLIPGIIFLIAPRIVLKFIKRSNAISLVKKAFLMFLNSTLNATNKTTAKIKFFPIDGKISIKCPSDML